MYFDKILKLIKLNFDNNYSIYMSQSDNLKSRLQKYGVLIAYAFAGMASLGIFAFKLAKTRIQIMQNTKTKSKTAAVYPGMKKVGLLGIVGVGIYSYGLWQILKRMPQSKTYQQMGENFLLPTEVRKNTEQQDHYIIDTMKMFGVSQQMIQRTKQQFKKIESETPPQKPSRSKQLINAFFERRKMQKQSAEQTRKQSSTQKQNATQKQN